MPLEHRTDRMSTAVNNMSDGQEFTARYEALLRHYRLEGQKIQAGKANENGDVEQRHHRLKRAVDQALLLRGSRDFARPGGIRRVSTGAAGAAERRTPGSGWRKKCSTCGRCRKGGWKAPSGCA